MAQVLVEEQSLSDTAAAIRSRLGGQDTYKPREFAAAINSIVDYATVTQTLTNASSSSNKTKAVKGESFTADITPDSGYRITGITVTMGGTDITSQVFKPGVGAKAITANGTYTAAEDNLSGYDTVTVAVPTGGANLGTKTITQNGTYAATTDSLDGYSEVTVNVSGGSTPTMQTKSVSYTPTASTQTETVTADAGYDGLQSVGVTVDPIPSQYIVPSGSQTVTENGTFDVSAIAEMVVNVASGGGSSVATGTVTPSAAATTLSFDTGLTTINGILVMPINTPLTGSRTQAAMICLPSGSFYKAISIHTNSGGTGWIQPTVYTSNRFTQSGTTVTVTGAYSFRPAVGYVWYAW